MFLDRSNTPVKQTVSSYIASSEFAYGGFNSFYAGGLSLIFKQTSYSVYVNITNSVLHNNTGLWCSDFLMSIDKLSCRYTMVRAEKVKSSSSFGPCVHIHTLWSAWKCQSQLQVDHCQWIVYTHKLYYHLLNSRTKVNFNCTQTQRTK